MCKGQISFKVFIYRLTGHFYDSIAHKFNGETCPEPVAIGGNV